MFHTIFNVYSFEISKREPMYNSFASVKQGDFTYIQFLIFIYKSGNAATVIRYCALSVLALYKHCSGNSALVRHFFFFFPVSNSETVTTVVIVFFFFSFRMYFFFLLYIYIYIYILFYYLTNFTIFLQLLRCQFFISHNKILNGDQPQLKINVL